MKKVAVLDNQVEARLLEGILNDHGIPHVLRSYHDSAYDGLFQGQQGWGHVEADEEQAEEIRTLLEQVRASGSGD